MNFPPQIAHSTTQVRSFGRLVQPSRTVRISALEGDVVLLRLGILLLLTLKNALAVMLIRTYIFLLLMQWCPLTLDRGILDHVLGSLGLPGWFRLVYFEYHARIRLRS